jgi:Spy/CpxP family protein refolding chaperone
MTRIRILVGLLALVLFTGGWLLGDDKKPGDTKADATPKARTLPQGWRQLGLSDEQRKKIHAIQDDYGNKIAALKKQMEDLQHEERAKMYDILTADQKKQLKDLREIKDSGGGSKDDKKGDKP